MLGIEGINVHKVCPLQERFCTLLSNIYTTPRCDASKALVVSLALLTLGAKLMLFVETSHTGMCLQGFMDILLSENNIDVSSTLELFPKLKSSVFYIHICCLNRGNKPDKDDLLNILKLSSFIPYRHRLHDKLHNSLSSSYVLRG